MQCNRMYEHGHEYTHTSGPRVVQLFRCREARLLWTRQRPPVHKTGRHSEYKARTRMLLQPEIHPPVPTARCLVGPDRLQQAWAAADALSCSTAALRFGSLVCLARAASVAQSPEGSKQQESVVKLD